MLLILPARIDVNVNYVNNLRNTQNGQSIYNNGRYVADTITVARNVRS